MVQPGEPIKSFEPLWGNWYADELLGEGGYGRVYKLVRRDNSGTYYSACKHITIPKNEAEIQSTRSMGMDKQSMYTYFSDMASRILNEINIMYALRGESNIVNYEDHFIAHEEGTLRWDVFIRMELLIPLSDYIMDNPMGPEEVRRLGIEVCSALEVCDARKIIHRDIKEGNIFLNPRGSFKLGDFGIARELMGSSMSMSMRGTPSYVAPEVYNGKPYDATVDLYSLGILMYKLLNNNRYPFFPPAPQMVTIDNSEQAFAMRMQGCMPLWPANGDDALRSAVMKVISFQPHQRFLTASDMKAALINRSAVSIPQITANPINAPVNSFNAPRSMPPVVQASQNFSSGTGYAPAQQPNGGYTYTQQQSYTPKPQSDMPMTGYAAQPSSVPVRTGRKKSGGLVLSIIGVAVLIIVLLIALLSSGGGKLGTYRKALAFENSGSDGDALSLFSEISDYKDSAEHIEALKRNIYKDSNVYYAMGDYSNASSGFSLLPGYERSNDYYTLCQIHLNGASADDKHTLVALIGFEDASSLLLSNLNVALEFLIGQWSCSDGMLTFSEETLDHSLSAPDFGDTWDIDNGLIYFFYSSDPVDKTNVYQLTIISENEISCYAYNNAVTYILTRE